MSRGEELASIAKRCVGTPWGEKGRAPGEALDCVGIVAVALRELGLPCQDLSDYSLDSHRQNYHLVCRQLVPPFCSIDSPGEPGDVVALKMARPEVDGHLVVYVGNLAGQPYMVEAERFRKVVMRPIPVDWLGRIKRLGGQWSAFRLT